MKLLTLSVVLVFTLAAEARTVISPGTAGPVGPPGSDSRPIPCPYMSDCPPGLILNYVRCQCVLPPCPRLACPPGTYVNKECECETDDCSKLSADVCTQVKCTCGKYCGLGTFIPGVPPPPGPDGEETDLSFPFCAACGCCSTYPAPPGPPGPPGPPCSGPCPYKFAP